MITQASESPRVGYLFDGCIDDAQGVPAYLRDVSGHMAAHGWDVHHFVGGTRRPEPTTTVLGRTAALGVNGNRVELSLPISGRRASAVLDDFDPDILHLQMPHNPFVSGRVLSRANPDIPVVATFHVLPNSPAMALAMRAVAKMTRSTNNRLDAVISNSTATQQIVENHYGIDSYVIPCPVDVERMRTGRRLEAYDDGKLNIVFLGRLVERKGVQHLINAVAGIDAGRRKDIRVLIAGTGELESTLKRQAVERGVAHQIKFLGFVEEADKPDLLASADLAIFPATGGESFGIVLAEAMAARAGVVIAGDNPGYRSVMQATPEMLVDPTDQMHFSNLIRELMLDDENRRMIHEVQQGQVAQFDTEVVGAQIEAVYRSLL